MSVDASIPKALYQANIDLALRIAALLQESGKQWFDLFAEETGTRMDEGLAQARDLSQGFSLDRLAALPSGALAHLLSNDMERWQALFAHLVDTQTHFAAGVQAALKAWQSECSEAFDQAGSRFLPQSTSAWVSSLPGADEVMSSIQQWLGQWLPTGAVAAGAGAAPAAARRTAAASGATAAPQTRAEASKAEAAPRSPAAEPKTASKTASKAAVSRASKARPKSAKAGKREADTAKTVKAVSGAARQKPGKAGRPVQKAAERRASAAHPAPALAPTPVPAAIATPVADKPAEGKAQ